jgi:hypothetical protein
MHGQTQIKKEYEALFVQLVHNDTHRIYMQQVSLKLIFAEER